MPRRTIVGPFSATEHGAGFWGLSAAGVELYLHVGSTAAIELLRDMGVTSLDLQWRADGVVVTLTGSRGRRDCEWVAATVIIHEPRNSLYEGLPLAAFDPAAQRFWRRIFTLMRIPGGRLLLGVIARRKSRPRKR